MGLYESYGIYGIKNKINNKIYIGKTCMNFGDRRDCHWACLRGGYGVNPHLQRAWDKYGEDNFEFVVIFECTNGETPDEVNELEIKYIKEYRENGSVYNISDGGDGGYLLGKHMSEETKRKIGDKNRINMTGRTASDETKAKMSESQKKRYDAMTEEEWGEFRKAISEYASGYSWSDESRQKFSELQQTNPNGAKYDAETVHKIRYMHEELNMDYTSISKELGIPRPTIYGIATYKRWKNI